MMEQGAMKLLYVNTGIRALININQAPAGETGNGPISLPITANASFFITLLPLENEAGVVYMPYTRKISAAGGGAISVNDGLVDLCIWPDNIVELNLYPLIIYRNESEEISPLTLSPLNFQRGGVRYTAYIYNEASSCFAVEMSDANRLVYLSPLPFYAVSAEVTLLHLDNHLFICASGRTSENKQYIYIANAEPSFSTCLCTTCEMYEFGGNTVSVVTEGDYKQVKTSYENKDGVLIASGKELGWFTCEEKQPESPEEACVRLIQAVKEDIPDAAMKCLTASLSDGLSFADLKEFLGDFSSIVNPITPSCPKNCIALKYPVGKNIYSARMFCIETKKLHGELLIDNIREP